MAGATKTSKVDKKHPRNSYWHSRDGGRVQVKDMPDGQLVRLTTFLQSKLDAAQAENARRAQADIDDAIYDEHPVGPCRYGRPIIDASYLVSWLRVLRDERKIRDEAETAAEDFRNAGAGFLLARDPA